MMFLKQSQREAIYAAKKTFLLSSYNDMERHFQQLNSDLIQGSKEFEKDMVDQRTIWCQTMIIAGSIMITALTCPLIQGNLPKNGNGNPYLIMVYSISNAGQFFITMLCAY
jgi:hypothetical protein